MSIVKNEIVILREENALQFKQKVFFSVVFKSFFELFCDTVSSTVLESSLRAKLSLNWVLRQSRQNT